MTIIQNQKQKKTVERLGPHKGYERETSQRKQASEAGRLLWFLVDGIIIAHHLGVKGQSVTEWGRSFVVKGKSVRWWGRSFAYACWSLVRILCLAQAFQHFFLLLVLNYGQNHFDDINSILFHEFT